MDLEKVSHFTIVKRMRMILLKKIIEEISTVEVMTMNIGDIMMTMTIMIMTGGIEMIHVTNHIMEIEGRYQKI